MPNLRDTIQQGLDLHRRGDLAGAERLYRQVLAADPRQADAWHLLGLLAHAVGNGPAAVELISRAIQLDGGQPSYHIHLAEAYRMTGDLRQAEAAARQAVRLDDQFAVGHNTLGVICEAQQRPSEAEAAYRRAVEIDPKFAFAHANLADLLLRAGRWKAAEAPARRALEINPGDAATHFTLGVVLQQQRDFAAARQCYEQVLALAPDHAEAHSNLGTLARGQGDYATAETHYRRALELVPDAAEVLNNLGNVLKRQARVAEAAECYDRALAIAPDNAQAHYNRGLVLLAAGNLAEGWPQYEWRDRCPEFEHRAFDVPRWQGEPLAGRTLLVHAEQGLGDTLQFVRFAPLVAEHGGRIVLEVQPALLPLLKKSGLDRFAELVGRGDELPPFDLHLPLVSLAGALGTTLDNIPAASGYLTAEPQLIAQWRERLAAIEGFRIGIAWQGSPTYRDDRERSISLAEFALLAIEGVSLVSLQKGPGVEQLEALGDRFTVHQLGNDLDAGGAFLDTAAVMKNLDLVIASDTAIAHLAGALGVPVWVALGQVPDWRWLSDREDSPWYDSARLFRQPARGSWGEVFARMAELVGSLDRQR